MEHSVGLNPLNSVQAERLQSALRVLFLRRIPPAVHGGNHPSRLLFSVDDIRTSWWSYTILGGHFCGGLVSWLRREDPMLNVVGLINSSPDALSEQVCLDCARKAAEDVCAQLGHRDMRITVLDNRLFILPTERSDGRAAAADEVPVSDSSSSAKAKDASDTSSSSDREEIPVIPFEHEKSSEDDTNL